MLGWMNVGKHDRGILTSLIWRETRDFFDLLIKLRLPQRHGKNGVMRRNGSGIIPKPPTSYPTWSFSSTFLVGTADCRTAFCIYLLDCGYVLFFGDRPHVAPYELRHTLPAHEHVYEARTAFEWQISFTPTNQAEYPVLLEMLLSSQVERPPSDISVMGNFLLLHGTPHIPPPTTPFTILICVQASMYIYGHRNNMNPHWENHQVQAQQ
jgi:hypothetical protein